MIFPYHPNFTLRRATKDDYWGIYRLMEQHWAVHTRIPLDDLKIRLDNQTAFIIEDRGIIRGTFMVERQSHGIGLITVVAIHSQVDELAALKVLLSAVEEEMHRQGLVALMQIGDSPWLTDELETQGFYPNDQLVTLEWEYQGLPSFTPHPDLQIRSAHLADLPDLLMIDELAFNEMWRKPHANFRLALSRAISFSVACLEQKVVGYQWCDRFGNHAHLTRLATHPYYQGQGIGAALLHNALCELIKVNIKSVSLNTQKRNIRSLVLYERFGFEQTTQIIDILWKDLV